MMAGAKRIYILMIRVKTSRFFFFSPRYVLKEVKTCSVSLSSHRKTRESLREREMLWEHKPLSGCFHSIPQLKNFLSYTSACFVRVINEKLLEYDLRATSCTYSRELGSKLGVSSFSYLK